MSNPFATNNKLGLPLATPSKQTVLPVYSGGNGMLRGWISIAETTFDGTEREFPTADGPVPITTITLPPLVENPERVRVPQYMAIVLPYAEVGQETWNGMLGFVSVTESRDSMRWVMPSAQGAELIVFRGAAYSMLVYGMDTVDAPPPGPGPGPIVQPAELRWAASLTVNEMTYGCGFFDFNWVELFKAQAPTTDPLRIETVSNPPGGVFKTTLVPYPNVTPLGAVEFNTIRILRLKQADAGAYEFTFKVTDTRNQSTNVVLTLNVV